MEIPRATYRLQFNEHFRLADAMALIPYLSALGISHVYASPLFKACAHSGHGYDVCDFSQLNPEIGTEVELEQFASLLRQHRMGLVLDIVPNHMGVRSRENAWWWDVLKNGRTSRFANHFDIDWESSDPALRGKILAPVLGDTYEHVLERGELKIEEQNGEPVLVYFDHQFPLAPGSTKNLSASPGHAATDELIQKQHYRLAFWGESDARLNYRRFFAIATLAGIRVEDEKVFHDSHSRLGQWLPWLDGLRVDHPDGLRDPKQYLDRLRKLAPDKWIVVEKILQPGEPLPDDWKIHGTVGYDFMNEVNNLFIQSANEKAMTDLYAAFTGEPVDPKKIVREKKRLVLETLFTTEVNRLVGILMQLAPVHSWPSFPPEQWRDALIELAASFPVYRTYVRPEMNFVEENDFQSIEMAVTNAKESRRDLPRELFDFITGLMLLIYRGERETDFAARFQQLTSPAMAKGVEDTAFYCLNRLISINEVGADPGRFGCSIEDFHKYCRMQRAHWPHSMLSASTHDTKRSEDVRARINLLSEIPDQWRDTVSRWSKINECHHKNGYPDRNAEHLYYQTLVGAWPLPLERILAYMEKASCEAKQHTDWNRRNAPYDEALKYFITTTTHDEKFIKDLEEFISALSTPALVNSLAQTLIRLTAPGVPDIYQGNELWDHSLVDPDNRRPVNFKLREELLKKAVQMPAEEAWKNHEEGLPKLWLIQKTLALRAKMTEAFHGTYEPLHAHGEKADHIIAFMRGSSVITIVPRFTLELNGDWKGLTIELPEGRWRNEFTGEHFSGKTIVTDLFQKFPVALLVKGD
ncbi:MAG TPA: malto-oligosyltrehalose synthase [Verrucomicrobiae bacterium]|jgi:(1->4)-alpha-D-glucan 1-alpha-D-glucosylmutase